MTTVEDTQLSELAQWVVLCNSELVGHYGAYEAARTGAREQGLNLLDCLIQKVGAQPPIILSYGS